MDHSSALRGIRAVALAFLTMTVTLAGCGKDGGGLTDPGIPGPGDPSDPSDPGVPDGPVPVGDVVYAVDLANNFLVFGTGSATTISAKMRISGLPILKRVIGIAIRPSDGALMAVGNDSRVYTLDPLTAEATPISDAFSPKIVDFFDTHFAMAVEPNGSRVRLVAAESGANWSISLEDGTAIDQAGARYGAGTAYEGEVPRLLGIVYPTLPDSAKQPGWCENLAYAIDADKAIVLASCDPAKGFWFPTGLTPDTTSAGVSAARSAQSTYGPMQELQELADQLLRCGEFMSSPTGSNSDGEEAPPQDNGPWFPRSPDTPFYTFLVKIGAQTATMGEVMPITPQDMGINVIAEVPAPDPIQSALFAKGGPYGPRADLRYDVKRVSAMAAAAADQPQRGPRASCS